MDKRIWVAVFVLTILTAAVIGAGIWMLTMKRDTAPMDGGGVTDHSDPNAPKEIVSREISGFSANFFVRDAYDESHSGKYSFRIEANDEGQMMLHVSGHKNGSVPVDPSVLDEVQKIIEKHELVKRNGTDRVTSGLPVQYSACSLSADYASGEYLSFRMNGQPDAQWCRDLKGLFFQVFADAGIEGFLPPVEAFTIDKCTLQFGIEKLSYEYGVLLDTDGVERFYRFVYDMEKEELLSEELIELDTALLKTVQSIVEECELETLRATLGKKYDIFRKYEDGDFLDITIDYENGRQLYLQGNGEELPEDWKNIRERLKEKLDHLFEQ